MGSKSTNLLYSDAARMGNVSHKGNTRHKPLNVEIDSVANTEAGSLLANTGIILRIL